MKEITKVEDLIRIFNDSFTTTFRYAIHRHFYIEFENSNVNETLAKLNKLHLYMLDITPKNRVVKLYPFTLNDVVICIESLNKIIEKYKDKYGISAIPSNLKLHTMLNDLTVINTKEMAKEVVKEVLNPSIEPKKLTKKEMDQIEIDKIIALRNLKNIKKQSNK